MMPPVYEEYRIKLRNVKPIHVVLRVRTISFPINIPSSIPNFFKVVGDGEDKMFVKGKILMSPLYGCDSGNGNQVLDQVSGFDSLVEKLSEVLALYIVSDDLNRKIKEGDFLRRRCVPEFPNMADAIEFLLIGIIDLLNFRSFIRA